MTVDTIPERPTHFYLSEIVAKTTAADGERLEIARTNNPFIWTIRGERNEAEINLEPFFQEALLHVLRGNDYTAPMQPVEPRSPIQDWKVTGPAIPDSVQTHLTNAVIALNNHVPGLADHGPRKIIVTVRFDQPEIVEGIAIL
jgi:hypothetical protein